MNFSIKIYKYTWAICLINFAFGNYGCSKSESYIRRDYDGQLAELYKEVGNVYEIEDPNIFLFGMGNRPKMMYHKGKLYDYFSDSVLVSFPGFLKDSILPSRYKVLIITKDSVYSITETERGIYVNQKPYFESHEEIRLPEFAEYKYGEVMRVLLQEILFNIKDGVPYPNIGVRQKPFYRDAAYAAMVLKVTGNEDLIKEWVNSLNSVYDHARSANYEESDNLGELLYLCSLFPGEHTDSMIAKVTKEAERISKCEKGKKYVHGKVDLLHRDVFSTKWLKFGLESNKINSANWRVPNTFDDYSDLFWMGKIDINLKLYYIEWNMVRNLLKEVVLYPYIVNAKAHYYHHIEWAVVNNIRYPLSWEGDVTKTKKVNKNSYSHIWAASELFLLLKEYKIK